MLSLQLPGYDFSLKKQEGELYILDLVRKKYVKLSPEEWVRQHFLNYLMAHLGYPRTVIKVEGGLKFGGLQKRADIVVFDSEGHPFIVVECKAPHVEISTQTLQQASAYYHTLNPRYIALTNGVRHLYVEPATLQTVEALPAFLPSKTC